MQEAYWLHGVGQEASLRWAALEEGHALDSGHLTWTLSGIWIVGA